MQQQQCTTTLLIKSNTDTNTYGDLSPTYTVVLDKKAKVKEIRETLNNIDFSGIQYVFCTLANVSKVLTGLTKVTGAYGKLHECRAIPHLKILPIPSLTTAWFDNHVKQTFKSCVKAYNDALNGVVKEEEAILAPYKICLTLEDTKEALDKLLDKPLLACDIETFGLNFNIHGLGSIAFAWSEHDTVYIDLGHLRTCSSPRATAKNKPVYDALAEFFEQYTGTLIFHNASFDVKFLIRNLFMDNLHDYVGLNYGLQVFDNIVCTHAMAYCCLNSTVKPKLSLKALAYDYVGEYAIDVKDIREVTVKNLAEYNCLDVVATMYVYNKYSRMLVTEDQVDYYRSMALPTVKYLTYISSVGMHIDSNRLEQIKIEFSSKIDEANKIINLHPIILEFSEIRREEKLVETNAKLKVKQKTIEDINYIFNSGSTKEMTRLFIEHLEYPILEYTSSGNPCLDKKTLSKYEDLAKLQFPEHVSLLEAIQNLKKIERALVFATNIYENITETGTNWLYGSYRFGSTVSGRLACSDPNLMQLPAHGYTGKAIKSCFTAPEGYIFFGLDYASLEDRINTLLTQDPNKRKVYTDGFDGHSLRTVNYWPDKFTHIDPNNPSEVNNIVSTEDGAYYRNASKPATFAMTYMGTAYTLHKNCGFSMQESTRIESNYHKMYEVSDQWSENQLDSIAEIGYAILAFGLKLRCPKMNRTIMKSKNAVKCAIAEKRTVNNAVSGQSYCQLNTRLGIELHKAILEDGKDIQLNGSIHDATYGIVKADAETVHWLNKTIVKLSLWKDLPELQDKEISLGGELDLFIPSWADPVTLDVDASVDDIEQILSKYDNNPNHNNNK